MVPNCDTLTAATAPITSEVFIFRLCSANHWDLFYIWQHSMESILLRQNDECSVETLLIITNRQTNYLCSTHSPGADLILDSLIKISYPLSNFLHCVGRVRRVAELPGRAAWMQKSKWASEKKKKFEGQVLRMYLVHPHTRFACTCRPHLLWSNEIITRITVLSI